MRGQPGRARRRRYLSLGLGELAAAVAFLAIAAVTVSPRLTSPGDRLVFWVVLVPLLAILLQAGAYWLLARSWVDRSTMPWALANAYRRFRLLDAALLAVSGGVALWRWPDHVGVMVLVAGIWLFGVIEYLNYFVVRLAYPLTAWPRAVTAWRTPRLVLDIRNARR